MYTGEGHDAGKLKMNFDEVQVGVFTKRMQGIQIALQVVGGMGKYGEVISVKKGSNNFTTHSKAFRFPCFRA